jgi:competence protein ComEC
MFAVFAIGYIIEREADLLNSLAVAAFLILLWNPKQLFDPSFQLSFASIASIFIFAPKIEGILKASNYVTKGVSVSIAAWIGTWPIIASYFNIASPVSVIANLIVIPASFISMMISIGLLCVSPFSDTLAGLFAFGLGFVDKALFWVNGALSRMPLAYFRLPAPSAVFVAAYYGLVLLWAAPKEGSRRRYAAWALVAILLAFNALVWGWCAAQRGDALKITFLDVGQGDSAFVEFPGGGNLLIDAGTGGEEGVFDTGRNVVAPYIWNTGARRIDAIIVTHPHADHLGGVPYLLKNFRVGMVIDNGAYEWGMKAGRVPRITVGAGDRIELPDGAEFFVLSPEEGRGLPDANAGSLVGKLIYKGRGVLFCGDTTSAAMGAMLGSYGYLLKSDIMKVPHHGGNVGDERTINKFFSAVSPAVSIISASGLKRRDRRNANAITNLRSTTYDTSKNGAIIARIRSTGCLVRPYVKIN